MMKWFSFHCKENFVKIQDSRLIEAKFILRTTTIEIGYCIITDETNGIVIIGNSGFRSSKQCFRDSAISDVFGQILLLHFVQ